MEVTLQAINQMMSLTNSIVSKLILPRVTCYADPSYSSRGMFL